MRYLKSLLLIGIVLITIISHGAYSQNINGQIVYSAEFNLDNSKSLSMDSDKLLYILSFSSNESIFKKQDVLVNENDKKLDLVTIFAGNGSFYSNVKANERRKRNLT